MHRDPVSNGSVDGAEAPACVGAPPADRYCFKQADAADELAAIQRLLYRTFVVEVRRYEATGPESLVDRFHDRNRYFIATRRGAVCGVTAVHDGPDYSVAGALDHPAALASLGSSILETRLLAVEPRERFGLVFAGLAHAVHEYARSAGYRWIVITGLARREAMYRRMGFERLGPPKQRGDELFVPMALELAATPSRVWRDLGRWSRRG